MALFKYVLIMLVVGACIYKLVVGSPAQRHLYHRLREDSADSEFVSSILYLAAPHAPLEDPLLELLASTLPRDTDTSAAFRLHPTVLDTEPSHSQLLPPTIPLAQLPNFGRQYYSGSGLFGPQYQFSFPHNSFPVPIYNRPSHPLAPAAASAGGNNAKYNQTGGVKPLSSSTTTTTTEPGRPTLPPRPSLTVLSPIDDDSAIVHITPKPLRGGHKPTTSSDELSNHIPHGHSQQHHIPTKLPQIIYSKPHGEMVHNTQKAPQKPQHGVASHVNEEESSLGPHSGDDVNHIQHFSDSDVIVRPLFSGGDVNHIPQIHQVYVVDFPGYGSFMVLGGPHPSAAHLPHTPVGYATLYDRTDGVSAVVTRH